MPGMTSMFMMEPTTIDKNQCDYEYAGKGGEL